MKFFFFFFEKSVADAARLRSMEYVILRFVEAHVKISKKKKMYYTNLKKENKKT